MKIEYSFYNLKVRSDLCAVRQHRTRHGTLLRITFADGLEGYADCHPWAEAGDNSLLDQLDLLKKGIQTTLSARSIQFARLDAIARSRKINLFAGLSIPQSHFFIPNLNSWSPDLMREAYGFAYFKLKLSGTSEELTPLKSLLNLLKDAQCKLRLDFNQRCSFESFKRFHTALKDYHDVIDFYEDPFPFDPQLWQKAQLLGANLACDAHSHQAIGLHSSAKILVIKPAIQSEVDFTAPSSQKIAVTSYLDHPFGQLCAAHTAAMLHKKIPHAIVCCGLQSHRIYEKNAFSEQLSWHKNNFVVPSGYGFGFDELLKAQCWKFL